MPLDKDPKAEIGLRIRVFRSKVGHGRIRIQRWRSHRTREGLTLGGKSRRSMRRSKAKIEWLIGRSERPNSSGPFIKISATCQKHARFFQNRDLLRLDAVRWRSYGGYHSACLESQHDAANLNRPRGDQRRASTGSLCARPIVTEAAKRTSWTQTEELRSLQC